MDPRKPPESDGPDTRPLLGLGVVLLGAYLLAREYMHLIPGFERLVDLWDRAGWPLAVIALGVAIVLFSRRPGSRIPTASSRLYRSRSDRMVAGVIGGVGAHFGVDATILRLAYAAAAVLLGLLTGIVVYVLLAIVVPSEPGSAMDL